MLTLLPPDAEGRGGGGDVKGEFVCSVSNLVNLRHQSTGKKFGTLPLTLLNQTRYAVRYLS
jgi:hypothetical protein